MGPFSIPPYLNKVIISSYSWTIKSGRIGSFEVNIRKNTDKVFLLSLKRSLYDYSLVVIVIQYKYIFLGLVMDKSI